MYWAATWTEAGQIYYFNATLKPSAHSLLRWCTWRSAYSSRIHDRTCDPSAYPFENKMPFQSPSAASCVFRRTLLLQTNQKILLEERQKLHHTSLMSMMSSWLVPSDIFRLQRCLTLSLKHPAQKFSPMLMVEVNLFNNFVIIENFCWI